MTIPVMRPWLGPEEAAAAAAAVASGWVAQGPRVVEFEEAFATAVGARHAVAVSSCTTALHLALVVTSVGPGDEVVVPSLSFIATANAVRYVGAQPVFADVDPNTQNLTPTTVAPHLTDRTRAVILVDQAGVPADLDGMRALCDPRGITVIEDAACAAGSVYRDGPVGAGARISRLSPSIRASFSLPGKEACSSRPTLIWPPSLRRLREHGMDVSAALRHASRQPVIEKYLETGFNYRMTDVQAAIGIVQLGKLDTMVARRRQLAERYQRQLSAIPGLRMIADPDYGATNYQSFWIVLPDDTPIPRDEVLGMLAHAGISARRGIMAAHLEPAYNSHPHGALPVTELLTARSLILPLFHDLTEEQQDAVVAAVYASQNHSEATSRSATKVP